MTPLEAAKALAAGDPVARGEYLWCVFCDSYEWGHDINAVKHCPDCPWLQMPAIVAALERLESASD